MTHSFFIMAYYGVEKFVDGKVFCTKCKQYKLPESFNECSLKKQNYICKTCLKKYRKNRKQNINRLIDNIYAHQVHSKSKVEVKYTWEELSNWLLSSTEFLSFYQTWVKTECNKDLTPAVIRKNRKQDFTIDNLLITTARDARMKNVLNRSRHVIQCDLDGHELAVYPNARIAAEMLGIKIYQNIHSVCKGEKKTCNGYRWKYK